MFKQTHLFRAGLSGKKGVSLVSSCTSQSAGVNIGCHPFKGPGDDRMYLKTVQLSDMSCFDTTWSSMQRQTRRLSRSCLFAEFLKNADVWNAENTSADGIPKWAFTTICKLCSSWLVSFGRALCQSEIWAVVCIGPRSQQPSAKTVGFRCARVQIVCPGKPIGCRFLLHISGSCRPKRARISQKKKLYLSFAQTKWWILTAETLRRKEAFMWGFDRPAQNLGDRRENF